MRAANAGMDAIHSWQEAKAAQRKEAERERWAKWQIEHPEAAAAVVNTLGPGGVPLPLATNSTIVSKQDGDKNDTKPCFVQS